MHKPIQSSRWQPLAGLLLFCVVGCQTYQQANGIDQQPVSVSSPSAAQSAATPSEQPAAGPCATAQSHSGLDSADSAASTEPATLANDGVTAVAYRGQDQPPTSQSAKTGPDPLPKVQLPAPRKLVDLTLPQTQASLTLDQIINTVLLADPRLRAGFQAINQANGEALQASLLPNPTLSATQTLLPLTRPFTVDEQGGPPQLDIGLSYPIDWFLFGKRAAAMMAAGLGVNVSEAEFADLIRQRVRDAALAYYDVLEAKAILELTELDAANFRQVEDITKKAVDGGNRPLVELNRVRLDRLKAEQSVRDAQNQLVAAKAALRALMGLADADPAFDVAGTLEMIESPEVPEDEEAYQIAVQNRPDIAALRWRIAQANAEVVSQRRQAYPDVIPQIGYTRQFQTKAIGFPDANSFGFGLEMSLPLYNRNQGNRYKAASVAVQQQFELQAGLVDLRAEITQLVKDLRTAAANAKAIAEQQLRLAVEVRDSINNAYAVGGRPLIDALDAQRNYRETYRLYIESRTNLGRAGVRFNAALGKKVTP